VMQVRRIVGSGDENERDGAIIQIVLIHGDVVSTAINESLECALCCNCSAKKMVKF